jgi:hypothetical protein
MVEKKDKQISNNNTIPDKLFAVPKRKDLKRDLIFKNNSPLRLKALDRRKSRRFRMMAN